MAVAGKNGKVIIGESGNQKVAAIKNWSLELSLETLETTALGDDWKNYITGLKEWTASSEGDYDRHPRSSGITRSVSRRYDRNRKVVCGQCELLSGNGIHQQFVNRRPGG